MYPGRHSHLNDPLTLIHVAPLTHGLLFPHSSKSVKKIHGNLY